MPYLILIAGVLIGLYALYRFFLNATIPQIKALLSAIAVFILALAMFYLAITGRLAAALGIGLACLPFASVFIKNRKSRAQAKNAQANISLTRNEALEILGLEEGADKEDIRRAYKNLMQKVHPDKEGSDWMAAKLNEARAVLLKDFPDPP